MAKLNILAERPRTRGDCKDGFRPCPWLGCPHHLGVDLETNKSGTVSLKFAGQTDTRRGTTVLLTKKVRNGLVEQPGPPDDELDELVADAVLRPDTCALDVADRGGSTLQEVGEVMGLTRERVRQIEERAFRRVRWADQRGAVRRTVEI